MLWQTNPNSKELPVLKQLLEKISPDGMPIGIGEPQKVSLEEARVMPTLRFPYGDVLSDEKLSMVGRAEQYLIDCGFAQVRVRIQDKTARIELPKSDFERFMEKDNASKTEAKLREFGFDFVTLDLGGYETGKMNRTV